MNVTLTLNDRLYTDIENLLKASDIKINDYLIGAIEDKFYTDKYGDLTEVLYKKEETIKEEVQDKTTEKIKKRVTRTRTIKSK